MAGPYRWTQVYQAVLFELDHDKSRSAAELAAVVLRKRKEQLVCDSGEDPGERDAVARALRVLEWFRRRD